MEPALRAALQSALDADPANVALRSHLCSQLLDGGLGDESLEVARTGLIASPAEPALLHAAAAAARAVGLDSEADGYETVLDALSATPPTAPPPPDTTAREAAPPPWVTHEPAADSTDVTAGEPAFAGDVPDSVGDLLNLWEDSEAPEDPGIGELSHSSISLADVGGMLEVKKRIETSFLMPMRNPEMQQAFGKSMRGGLLLWGPPGCGKTFLARAIAGELGASFYHVALSDVLDMYIGSSERNVAALFDVARRNSPCVLFLDEVDAIGQKRTQLRSGGSAMRGVVNQLLQEMDGATSDNEGVFVLAATNHPWDIDSALLRPGRLDRMLLVLPPDTAARESILELHLRHKPTAGLDLSKVAGATDGLTGADLALLCEQATEYAMSDSVASGSVRPIDMKDLARAVQDVRPSHGPWFDSAKNFALFNNESGRYDELLEWIRVHRDKPSPGFRRR